ncbi:MAG: hypothetical protein HY315_00185 [Acidobacteria bacterium]|nr:hypothetical protein [Acidobacteriota bacterium]
MKRSSLAPLALGALVLVFLSGGWSREKGSQSSAAAPPPEPAASSGIDAPVEAAQLSTPSPNATPMATAKGVGTIKGILKSPYARVAEGVVFVENVEGKLPPPRQNPVMDQKNKIFTPHLLPVLVGSTVDFPNTDDVRHSVYSRDGSATSFNLGQYDAGIVKHVMFDKIGVTHLACNIHTEMSAYVIASQNPYFALTDRQGNFEIRNVPAGRRKLSLFHEKLEPTTVEVTVEPNKVNIVEFTGLKRRQ